MNTKTITSAFVLLALSAALPSCSRTDAQDSAQGAQSTATSPEVPAPVPTAEPDVKRLIARAQERWNWVTNADWIQVYDFFSPDHKRIEKLTAFLGGKEHHEYGEASKPALVGIEDGKGYLEIIVDWTPHHPELQMADNLPSDPNELKQTLTMIETWLWIDGEWFYQGAERRDEFFELHPKLAKKP